MESFLVELKKEVNCSLCSDTLIEPKILKCFHTFCKACIKRHAKITEEVNVFKCFECKSLTPLPELNSVEDLKPSQLHSRILKGLALVEGEKVCSVSESHSPSSLYCFDCDHSLCDECEQSHAVFTKDHKVVRLATLKKEDIELIITKENHCKVHPNQRLELFCDSCEAVICLTCLKDSHRGHVHSSLTEFASRKKIVLSKHLEVIENLMLNDMEKREHEEIAYSLKQQREIALREIQEKTKRMIETLRKNEKKLLNQVMESFEQAETNLNIVHHLPAVKEYINRVMKRGLASEMMDIQETECCEEYILNPISRYSRIAFIPNEELLEEVNVGLGEIQRYCKTDHTMSIIDLEFEQAAALRQGKLKLITKSSTGELNYDPWDSIDVTISPEENVEIKENCVRTDGRIEVEFVAKVAGCLTAEVRVNGNHVSNSPLVMNVKTQQIKVGRQLNLEGLADARPKLVNGIAINKKNSRFAVADESAHCVHVFNTHGDLLLTYGDQDCDEEQLNNPEGLAFLNDTDLVIADSRNHRICTVDTTTGKLLKTFGNQGNGDGEFCFPYGVHVEDDGNIIVCDRNNHRVQVFTSDGEYQYQFGLEEEGSFTPISTVTHDGRFYVSDTVCHVIHVFEKEGNEVPTRISTIGEYGITDGRLNKPWGLAIDNDHHLLVCDHENYRIQKFTLDGRLVGKTSYKVDHPAYITVTNDGHLLMTSYMDGVLMYIVE